MKAWAAVPGALALAALLSGCSTVDGPGYYAQAVRGHLQLLADAKPVNDWVSDPATPAALRERLALSQRIRSFAVTELHLPDNASYRRYADLKRRSVVWNVVATPELSLQLKQWCFPVAGCVGYRGYYAEADAQALAAQLRSAGLDVTVYGVPAYSTLGWLNWLGGDPLLNTFIHYPEGELARIVFHELAHQVVYVNDDSVFNESFASFVEQQGAQRWLAERANDAARSEYAAFDARRREFRALALRTRDRLRQVYGEAADATTAAPAATATPANADAQRAAKAQALADFRAGYTALRARWGGWAGYDGWVAQAGNASFAIQGAYEEWVPAFAALFEREGRDWRRFYDATRTLSRLPREERRAALARLN
ncbi:MAG: hypothetical protein RL014_888 [Pseudomonadota bacterium]